VWWVSGVDDQRLENAEHELDEAIHVFVCDADAVPVDVETLEQ
jgi:hypothetical protein